MYKYVFRRIYQLIIVFFLFLVTSYVLFDSIPGNAFQSLLLNPELPREAYDLVIQLYGLDKPLYDQQNQLNNDLPWVWRPFRQQYILETLFYHL